MEREKSSGRVRARFDLRFSLVGGAVAGARTALPPTRKPAAVARAPFLGHAIRACLARAIRNP
jgi:hypothetical protein